MKSVGKASVTKALKILENENLTIREMNKDDKRSFSCYITKKGEDIIEDLIKIKNDVEKILFNNFTLEEKEDLYHYIKS